MLVTKPHTLQIGDIVTIKAANPRRGIGIIKTIKSVDNSSSYCVTELHKENGFFVQSKSEYYFQLEDLTLFPDRARWVIIKRDIERQNDRCILHEWINNL